MSKHVNLVTFRNRIYLPTFKTIYNFILLLGKKFYTCVMCINLYTTPLLCRWIILINAWLVHASTWPHAAWNISADFANHGLIAHGDWSDGVRVVLYHSRASHRHIIFSLLLGLLGCWIAFFFWPIHPWILLIPWENIFVSSIKWRILFLTKFSVMFLEYSGNLYYLSKRFIYVYCFFKLIHYSFVC